MCTTIAVSVRRGEMARPISVRAAPETSRTGMRGPASPPWRDRRVIVYSVAAELNLTIGRDLGVLGFDGSVGGSILHPALTRVVRPPVRVT